MELIEYLLAEQVHTLKARESLILLTSQVKVRPYMALDKASRAEEACSWFKGLISYNPNTDSGIMGNIHKQLLHIVHI